MSTSASTATSSGTIPAATRTASCEQSRAGVADMLSEMGGDAVAALSQAAGEATFDRTVDLATAMMTEPDLHDRLRARIEAEITDDTRVLVAHSLGTVLSYSALAAARRLARPHLRHARLAARRADDVQQPGAGPRRRPGRLARLGAALGQRPGAERQGLREPALADHFGPRVEEFVIDNGHRAHAPEPYLNSRPTGAAIAAALGSTRPGRRHEKRRIALMAGPFSHLDGRDHHEQRLGVRRCRPRGAASSSAAAAESNDALAAGMKEDWRQISAAQARFIVRLR